MDNPKIEKSTHYNVIMMSDDGEAKTYRMRRGTIRFLLFFPFLMLLLGGGVIAGGVYFSKDYFKLKTELAQQDGELNQMRTRLQKLKHYEALLTASSGASPVAKHEEIGVAPSRGQSSPSAPESSETEPPGNANSTAEASASDAAAPEPTAPNGQEEEAAPESAAPVAEAAQTQTTAPAEALPDLDFNSMDKLSGNKSPLRVSDFTARTLGQQRVRIRYDLTSAGKPGVKTISGLARHFAVFADGKRAELPLPDNGETRFSLTRLRPMEATARLPQGFDTKDIKKIDVVIVTDEYGVFHDLYDVTHWRSY